MSKRKSDLRRARAEGRKLVADRVRMVRQGSIHAQRQQADKNDLLARMREKVRGS